MLHQQTNREGVGCERGMFAHGPLDSACTRWCSWSERYALRTVDYTYTWQWQEDKLGQSSLVCIRFGQQTTAQAAVLGSMKQVQ
jgi:hypothetical protein